MSLDDFSNLQYFRDCAILARDEEPEEIAAAQILVSIPALTDKALAGMIDYAKKQVLMREQQRMVSVVKTEGNPCDT